MRWLAVLPLVLVAACTAGSGEEPISWQGREYVALGDSYTAAPGVGVLTGPPACGRTDGNYPHRVAAALELDLTDASCSAARTAHLTESQVPRGVPVLPQLDALSPDTALVTVGIGANDHRLFGTLIGACRQLATRDPSGAPCATAIADRVETGLADLRGRFDDLLDDIAGRAPDARIVVVGYPQFVPEDAPERCPQLPLAAGDYAFASEVSQLLNDVLAEAAARADVAYVDVFAATEGHDICADDPWIAGETPTKPATPYHPYAEEQQAAADLIVEKITG